jgi:preprotein translocase subunit Sec61beta
LYENKNSLNQHNVNNGEDGRSYSLSHTKGFKMSKKKKESKSPMPAASAGLLRFFEEETEGVKVRPEILVGFSIALIVVCALAHVFF